MKLLMEGKIEYWKGDRIVLRNKFPMLKRKEMKGNLYVI